MSMGNSFKDSFLQCQYTLYQKGHWEKKQLNPHFLWHSGISFVAGIYFSIQAGLLYLRLILNKGEILQ